LHVVDGHQNGPPNGERPHEGDERGADGPPCRRSAGRFGAQKGDLERLALRARQRAERRLVDRGQKIAECAVRQARLGARRLAREHDPSVLATEERLAPQRRLSHARLALDHEDRGRLFRRSEETHDRIELDIPPDDRFHHGRAKFR